MTMLAPRYVPLVGIGRGGMGRVDLAVATGLPGAEQLVVLKRLREPEEAGQDDDDARRDLVREARLSARLMHPNIAATLGLDFLGHEVVLVLEYLEGATLSALARSCEARGESIPPAILLRIVRDALAGLSYAHELRDYDGTPLGIVHRDVSPANVLVTTDGITKVLDFGIAKGTRTTSVTPLGTIKGKLGYMAPEQMLGGVVDGRTDLYAIGVILWEGLTGQRFSSPNDVEACVSRRLEADPPSVRAIAPAVPPPLEALVRTCLARDPRDRWPSASMLSAALDSHAATYGWNASTYDVAGFVARHCGEELQARRAFLRDRFAQLVAARRAPERVTARMIPSRPSVAPVAIDLASMGVDGASRSAVHGSSRAQAGPYAAASRERKAGRFVLPLAAMIVGAGLSYVADEVRVRARDEVPRPRRGRVAEISRASTSGVARGKAEHAPGEPPCAPPRAKAVAAPVAPPLGAGASAAAASAPSPMASTAAKASDEAASPASGFVTIDSYPWSRVSIDGVAIGVTPVVRASLPPGAHVVVLESPEHGRHEIPVTIREGETTAHRWEW
ncbi:MAG: serine/threonine protein kinase [Deltaproteobacteria bacterium]|nr:serine/threonine protein kinase [Deltaproteobacteria bacterium]